MNFMFGSNLNLKAFNLETVSQGQDVARINMFALVFLPLSLVAVRNYINILQFHEDLLMW